MPLGSAPGERQPCRRCRSRSALGISVTFLQPGSATAATTNTLVPDGSELYRIAPDGAPSRLAILKEDVVYGLALRDGALIAATGNRGRLYRIDLGRVGEGAVTDLAHVEAGQATALAPSGAGLLIATSNAGKVFRLSPANAPRAVYTSDVFDAKVFAHWGRAEVQPGSAGYRLELRTGNVPRPLEGWSARGQRRVRTAAPLCRTAALRSGA